jgi:hypothetical protein
MMRSENVMARREFVIVRSALGGSIVTDGM